MKKIVITVIVFCLLLAAAIPTFALTTSIGSINASLSALPKEKTGDTQIDIKCRISSSLKRAVSARYLVLKDSKVVKAFVIADLKKAANLSYLTKDKFLPGNYRVELQIKDKNTWKLVAYSKITIKDSEAVPTVSNIHFIVDDNTQKLHWTNPKDISKVAGFEIYTKKDGETQWSFNYYASTSQNSMDLAYLSVLGNSSAKYMLKIKSKAKPGFKDSETVCGKELNYIYTSECNALDLNMANIEDGKITINSHTVFAGHQYLIITRDATDQKKVNRKLLTASQDKKIIFNVDSSDKSLDRVGNILYLQEFFGNTNGDGYATIWSTLIQTRGTAIVKEQLVNLEEVGTYSIPNRIQADINQCTLPDATPQHLPYWTGFNMCNKMNYVFNSAYQESDIKKVHDMGFNFIRAAIHYKTLLSEDGTKIKMSQIEDIDNLIEWGIKYNVHINLDLHYLPGHGPDDQGILKQDLFMNEANKKLACDYWTMLAKRYVEIPNKILSFNLLNEPHWGTNDQDYATLMSRIAGAVRTQDPDRLMIIDGLNAGNIPSEASKTLGMAQSMHFYEPAKFTTGNFNITGGLKTPIPQGWPMEYVFGTLSGGAPSESVGKPSTITINGNFSQGTKIKVNVDYGWSPSAIDLVIKVDGVEIKRHTISSGDPEVFVETAAIQGAAKKIEISAQGQQNSFLNVLWVSVIEINKQVDILSTNFNYDSPSNVNASIITIDGNGKYKNTNPADIDNKLDINWMRKRAKLWKDFSIQNNVGIMCGEFGVANSVPHQMTLDYLEDWFTVLQENKIGWSFYEFTNWFGVFNSNRKDVKYEPYGDLLLDREMLTLLQKYQKEAR